MSGKLAEALVRAGVNAADAYDVEEELGLRKDGSVNLTATTSSDGGIVVPADKLRGRLPTDAPDWMFLRPSGAMKRFYVPSPYGAWGSGGAQGYVVHPSICWVPGGFAGYEYWLAYTPLPTGENRKENPCVAATNDINAVNWELPPGAPNPIVDAPPTATAYNRDAATCYVKGIGLVVMWNERGDDVTTNLYNRLKVVVFDGKSWSEPVEIWRGKIGAANVGDMASPSLSYDASTGTWWIYGHNADDTTNKKLRRMSSSSLTSGWPAVPEDCTYTAPTGRKLWHSEIKRLPSGRVVGFAQDNASDSGAGHLYVLQARDGLNFEMGLVSDLSGPVNANGFHYRPSWFAVEKEGKLAVTVINSHLNVPHFERQEYEVVSQRENKVREYRRLVDAVAQAKLGPARGLFAADDFVRADTTTGLGTTINGLAWTNQDANAWGIQGNLAYNTTTGNCVAWMDPGKTAYSVSVLVAATGSQGYLVVGRLDALHCWRFGFAGSALNLHQYDGTLQGELGTPLGIAVKPGDILRVDVSGQSAQFFLNGQLLYRANGTVPVSSKIALQASGASTTKFGAIVVTDLE